MQAAIDSAGVGVSEREMAADICAAMIRAGFTEEEVRACNRPAVRLCSLHSTEHRPAGSQSEREQICAADRLSSSPSVGRSPQSK